MEGVSRWWTKIQIMTLSIAAVSAFSSTNAVFAQGGAGVQKRPLEHASWYTANPEIQIIDNRPVIKDFREAPKPAQTIQLPDAPPGYNPNARVEQAPLPKSGFGQSNISANGFKPGNLAPVGQTAIRKRMGQVAAPGKILGAKPVKAASRPVAVASYGKDYFSGGPTGESSLQSSSTLRGKLLRH